MSSLDDISDAAVKLHLGSEGRLLLLAFLGHYWIFGSD